ncbi:hypothetical protein HMPREF0201_02007 [Cedecea davisae DSM 4568]|uniref:Uncharacterized protein n=1 Tax=Cedecea davisae DSM 4568 TaxID=566551 RepID=S3IXL0_9ENTR|nr:hypothetical protein HMPREF0201_02007 [Cedecea davisae DSM 4568]
MIAGVYRFSGDELAGRRGWSGGMAYFPLTRSPFSGRAEKIDSPVNGT